MPPAVAIAGIGAAASIGGAVLGSHAQNKAAGKAADVSSENNAANIALTRDIYNQNASRLDPIYQGGMRAGNALQGLLGISGMPGGPATGSMGGGTPGSALGGGIVNPANMPDMRAGLPSRASWAGGALQAMGINNPQGDPIARLQTSIQNMTPQQQQAWAGYLQSNPDPDTVYEQRQADYRTAHPAATTGTPGTPGQTPQQSATAAWDAFRNSTNYQFRFNEGNKALQMSALPGGGFDSGSTRKALLTYGQNFAANELGGYMDRLAQQQQMGLAGASALAGVSQNMVTNVTAGNNANAANQANAALVAGNANANMWNQVGSSVGTAIGALGSSYVR